MSGRNTNDYELTKRLLGVVSLLAAALLGLAPAHAHRVRVASAGFDIENTHQATHSKVTRGNIGRMRLEWVYETIPGAEFAGVETPPLMVDDMLYFPDIDGNLHAVNATTGKALWVKSFLDDYSDSTRRVFVSRNTPVVHGDTLYIGAGATILGTFIYCETTNDAPGCVPGGDGSYLLAINRHSGELQWATRIHDYFLSIPTASPVLHKGRIFITLASYEELINPSLDPAPGFRDTFYRCCRFRGKTVAVDLYGNLAWEWFHTPGQDAMPAAFRAAVRAYLEALPEQDPRHLPAGDPLPIFEGFYGVSSWGKGNPAIDDRKGLVLVAPGSNYGVPELVRQCQRKRDDPGITPDPEDFMPHGVTCATVNEFVGNYLNSVVALDIRTGKPRWVFGPQLYDTWNHICVSHDVSYLTFEPGLIAPLNLPDQQLNCDPLVKPDDYGFGQEPMILRDVRVAGRHHGHRARKLDLVAIGQKSGELFVFDLDTGGRRYSRQLKIAEGGILGGLHFGAATDGRVIYMSATNAHSAWRDVRDPYVSATEEDPDFGRNSDPRLPARISGPRDIRTLINPAPDVFIDADVEIHFVAHCDELATPEQRDRCVSNEHFANEFGHNPFKRVVRVIRDWRDLAPGANGSPNAVPNPIPENVATTPGNKILTVRDLNDCAGAGVSSCAVKSVASFWFALDAGRGKILWTQIHPGGGYIKAAHTVANGVLYSGAEGSEALFVDEFTNPGGGTVIPVGGGLRYALDTRTGRILFRFHDLIANPDDYVVTHPAVVGKHVYWGSGSGHYNAVLPEQSDNRLFAFGLQTRKRHR